MKAYVVFDLDGQASPILWQEQPGTEELEFLTESSEAIIDFLASHRRTVEGDWVLRDPVVVPEPTPEEIEAAREADYQARLRAWEAEVSAAIDASEPWRAYKWGEITLTAYRPQAQAIRNSIPMPER